MVNAQLKRVIQKEAVLKSLMHYFILVERETDRLIERKKAVDVTDKKTATPAFKIEEKPSDEQGQTRLGMDEERDIDSKRREIPKIGRK